MERCFFSGLCRILWVLLLCASFSVWVQSEEQQSPGKENDFERPVQNPSGIDPYESDVQTTNSTPKGTSPAEATSQTEKKPISTKGIVLINPSYSQSELPFPWMYPWTVEFEKCFTEELKKLKRPDRGINYQSARRYISEDRATKNYEKEQFARLLQYGGGWSVFVGEFEMICDALVNSYDSITNTALVLCSYKDITPEFQEKHPRITGVTIVPGILKTMQLAKELSPKSQEIAVITDDVDMDPTQYENLKEWILARGGNLSDARRGADGAYAPAIGTCEAFKNCKIKLISGTECTTQEMLKVLQEMPAQSLIVFSNWRNFHRDGFSNLPAVISEINKLKHPLFTVSAMPYPEDAVGGYISQSQTCAKKAASLVEKIFESPQGTIIPALRDEGELVIDMAMIKKYRLKASKIPQDALILNPVLPIWVAYQSEVVVAAVSFGIVVFLLIGISVLYRRHVRYTKKTKALLGTLPVRIYAADAEGKLLFLQMESDQKKMERIPKSLEEVEGLNAKKVKGLISDVIRTGNRATKHFDYGSMKRLETFSRLEKDVFGKDAVIWVSQDITSEYLLREQVSFALDSLCYAAELADISCFHTDPRGGIILDTSNRSDASNWGTEKGESVSAEKWVFAEDLEKFQKGWKELLEGKIQKVRLSYRSEYTGVLRYYSMIASVRHGTRWTVEKVDQGVSKKFDPIFGVIQDITLMGQNERKLEAAMKAAEAADRAKSYFIATMSHELRTPLNSVIGFSELLQYGGNSEEEVKEYLKTIYYAGNSLLTLVNDLLDLSKIEADQLQVNPRKTNLPDLINQVYGLFVQKAKIKHLDFVLHLPEAVPSLYLDDLRLRQVLINLLGNAFKFTHSGSVDLSAEFECEPGQKEPVGTLKIHVADTGVGIKKDYLERVFEPFVQQDEGATRGNRSYEGTGLGLAISRQMIRKMGGDIILSSEDGKGSVFTVELKKIKYEYQNEQPVQKTEEEATMNDGIGDILLVDDVEANLQMLDAMLKRMGFKTKIAFSGEKALEILKDMTPEFVMTDLWMPGMTGGELAARIRQDSRLAKTKIVAITADVEAKINFDMQYFDGVIFKPLTLSDLRKFVDSHRESSPTS